MDDLTPRQKEVLEFVQTCLQRGHSAPTLREIAAHFGFQSTRAAADHLEALKRKGMLESAPGKARALRVKSPLQRLRQRVVDIPLLGNIPAGFADLREQEIRRCISIDTQSLGLRPTRQTFALRAKGDSMIGRHILDGDLVILEAGRTPDNGEVVAALIDGESTLKTFRLANGKPFLQAENPHYPSLIPAEELLIQGVMVGLLRKCR
ncbi:MAG: transcriptional repressor LexA [Verrucomicrobiota bacterium]